MGDLSSPCHGCPKDEEKVERLPQNNRDITTERHAQCLDLGPDKPTAK